MRPVPDAGVALVKAFEGCRLTPYRDAIGLWTIGWGHLVSRDREAAPPAPITQEEADALLAADLARMAAAVARLLPVPLTDGQYGAVVSFTFNLGAGNLQTSALRRKILRGDHHAVPGQLMRWVHAGGVKLAGLARRRAAEAAMYAGGQPRASQPARLDRNAETRYFTVLRLHGLERPPFHGK